MSIRRSRIVFSSLVILLLLFTAAVTFSQDEAVTITVIGHAVHESAITGGTGADIDLGPQIVEATGVSLAWDTQPWPGILERTVRELALSESSVSMMFLISQQYSPQVRSQLMPLNDFLESDPIEDFEGIAPGMISFVSDAEGNIYGIPMRAFGPVLFYNTAILEQHGITEPPTSWEEFIEYATAAAGRRDDGARIYGMRFEASVVIDWARALGGDVLSPEYEILFTEEPMIQALEGAAELYQAGVIPPDFMNLVADDWLTLEQNGQVAFAMRGPTYYNNLNDPEASQVIGQIGVTVVPASSTVDFELVPGNAAFWSMSIPANSANPEAAWQVIKYLSSSEAARLMALNGNAPTRLDVYDDPDFVETNAAWAEQARRSLEVSRPYWPAFDEQPRAQDIFEEQVVLAITGQKSPEEAMADAAELIAPLLPTLD
jgi:multiple sugar transport system substrate-binding protein